MVLSRLPIAVGPASQETVVSYLTRLANLHGLPVRELWEPISTARPGCGRCDVVAERLAAVTGWPLEHLTRALPELHPTPDWAALRHQPQPGCPRCNARHPGGRVTHLLAHHRYVCTRHRYWIGRSARHRPGRPCWARRRYWCAAASPAAAAPLRPGRHLRPRVDGIPDLRTPVGGSAPRLHGCGARMDPPRRGPHPGGHRADHVQRVTAVRSRLFRCRAPRRADRLADVATPRRR
jgi:hypothetical protein